MSTTKKPDNKAGSGIPVATVTGTGTINPLQPVIPTIKPKKPTFWERLEHPIARWMFVGMFGLIVIGIGTYIDSQYVPRTEISEKYALKVDLQKEDDMIKALRETFKETITEMELEHKEKLDDLEDALRDYVKKDVYDTRNEGIKDQLDRIERGLDANNQTLRQLLERGGGS